MSGKKIKKWASNPVDAVVDLAVNAVTLGTVGYQDGKLNDGFATQAVQSVGGNIRDATGITAAQEQANAASQMLLNEQKSRELQQQDQLRRQQATETNMSNAAARSRRRNRSGSTNLGSADDMSDLSSDFLGV